MTNAIFKLNNSVVNPVKEWEAIQVLATFDQTGGEANITTEEFIFVNENAVLIRDYIAGGVSLTSFGIFEGIPFTIEIQNGSNQIVFDGFLDLTTYKEISPVEVRCKVKKYTGLNSLAERSQGLTMRYLIDIGVIDQNDYVPIPYIKEKPLGDSVAELAVLSLTLFTLSKQIIEFAKSISNITVTASGIAVSGVTGPAGAVTYTVGQLVIESIYNIALLIYLFNLYNEILEILIPPVRVYSGCKPKVILTKALAYLGYDYSTTIAEMDNLYLLPSKREQGRLFITGIGNAIGTPDNIDYAYTLSEMIELINTTFNARVTFIGNTLHQESLINDSFWQQNASYQFPDVENEIVQYNTEELNGRYLISFDTDLSDEWTILEFEGTNFEIVTQPDSIGDTKRVLIKGYDESRIPYCLGSRKNKLNPVEVAVLGVAIVFDFVINLFGGNSTLSDRIRDRKGMLRITGESLATGKLLYYFESGEFGITLPEDYKDNYWSAEILWNKYISDKSFVLNNYRNQKFLFTDLKIPFGFEDFTKLIDNSYAQDQFGNWVKIETLKWSFDQDFALVSGWRRQIYTKNLKEYYHIGTNGTI